MSILDQKQARQIEQLATAVDDGGHIKWRDAKDLLGSVRELIEVAENRQAEAEELRKMTRAALARVRVLEEALGAAANSLDAVRHMALTREDRVGMAGYARNRAEVARDTLSTERMPSDG